MFWKRVAKSSVVLLAAFALAACGSEDDDGGNGGNGGGGNGGIGGVGAAVLTISPAPVSFPQVNAGQTEQRQVTILNTGDGAASIELTLRESNEDGQREFSYGDDWPGDTFSVPAGGNVRFTVYYEPANDVADSGVLEIRSNAVKVNDAETGDANIDITTPNRAPSLFSPDTLRFQRVSPDNHPPEWQGESQVTIVQNVGSADLSISEILLGGGSDNFRVTFPAPDPDNPGEYLDTDPTSDIQSWEEVKNQYPEQTTLAASEQFPIRVWFKPDDNLPEEDELIFFSNDPQQSEYIVTLLGNSGSPCINLSVQDQVDFGQVSVAQTAQKTITIENCARTPDLEISAIELTDDAGGVLAINPQSLPDGLPDMPAILPARERTNFVMTCTPAGEEVYQGELRIVSDDPASPEILLPVSCSGTNNQCPQASAVGKIQGTNVEQTYIETLPLDTIEFDGTASTDPDGTVARHEWTVLSRPQGSTARLLPNAQSPTPRLFLDLAGEYEVELKVYDDQGTESCNEPAIVTIIAVPDDDIHVQLVWDSPSDPDQTDTYGTDLDLHYMHPIGDWNSAPWDIFWQNRTADWGMQGNPNDDPSLDIDDTDGAGPENVNHSNPEQGKTYRTGVYYYDDHQLGASYATMRIYIRGQLAFEAENHYMPGLDTFWDVGAIDWPSGSITILDRMHNGFPGSN